MKILPGPMTPSECRQRLLTLADLVGRLPADVLVIEASVHYNTEILPDEIQLNVGIESAAETLALAAETTLAHTGKWYIRTLTTPEGQCIRQMDPVQDADGNTLTPPEA